MLKIKIKTQLDICTCYMFVEDITEFGDTGFLSPSEEYRTNWFYIHDFVSFTALTKIKNNTVTLINEPKVLHIPQDAVNSVYKNNFRKEHIKIPYDGHLNIGRYYIVTKDIFEAQFADTDDDYVYYDLENKVFVYRVNDCTLTTKCISDLFSELDLNLTAGIYVGNQQFVSTCHLERCYLDMLKLDFNTLLGTNANKAAKRCFGINCDETDASKKLKANIDLLKKALTIVDYHNECDELAEAGYIVDLLGRCNGICKNIGDYDCGCEN